VKDGEALKALSVYKYYLPNWDAGKKKKKEGMKTRIKRAIACGKKCGEGSGKAEGSDVKNDRRKDIKTG